MLSVFDVLNQNVLERLKVMENMFERPNGRQEYVRN